MPHRPDRGTARAVLSAAALASASIAWAPGAALAEIKLGSVLSVTGPASFLGDPEQKTLEMYVEKINEEGGILGEEVRLIVYDDTGDANTARTFATRLIEDDRVDAIIGGTTTGTTMAVVPLVEDAEIPFISLAGAVVIIDPVKPWVFKTPHTDRMACEKIFEDMQKQGIARIGLISGAGGFDTSMREQCLAVAPDHGIEVVADESYGARDTDMTPQLTNIRNAPGVQAVLNAGFGQGPAVVTRNFAQLGLDVPLYQSHGVASKSFIELAGEAANGVRLPAAALLVAEQLPDDDPQKPVVVDYKRAFEERWNQPVSTFGGHAYDALFILKDAIERAGSKDPEAVREAIERTEGFIGTAGEVNMSEDDHLGLDLSAFRMLEIEDGDWKLVD
ncbi:MAG TPA: ABC transporter substrate-binding protein [Geminicoccaceae bacterium]|nr:ABC transporter substrate-binding protein [Geminicoccaceae bacterium]